MDVIDYSWRDDRQDPVVRRGSTLEMALTPDGKTLLVVNSGSNTVSLFDVVP